MAQPTREKRIKSADRVLEIFELFSAGCNSVTVMDVARALDMPQSSTSELLGSLERRGYLQRDRAARTFRPTARVALLGAWVQPQLFRRGLLLPMMDELAAATGHSAVLAMMVGVGLRHVHAVGAGGPVGGGAGGHLLHSPFGLALMSVMHCDTVRKLAHRLNAESPQELHVRPSEIEARLELARRQGYVTGALDIGNGPGRAAVAMVLPHAIGEEQLAIGLVGPEAAIAADCERLVQGLRGAIAARLARRIPADDDRIDARIDWGGERRDMRRGDTGPDRTPLAAVH